MRNSPQNRHSMLSRCGDGCNTVWDGGQVAWTRDLLLCQTLGVDAHQRFSHILKCCQPLAAAVIICRQRKDVPTVEARTMARV